MAATNFIVDRIERELDRPESFAKPINGFDFEELPTIAGEDDSRQLDLKTNLTWCF